MTTDNRSTEKKLWESEPSKDCWISEAGYGCFIVRVTDMLHLCGYVGVPSSHPWFGKGYDDCRMANNEWPEVHGGLTYAHDHAPNEAPDGHWWLGFDCAHAGDLSPGMNRRYVSDEVYRDFAYVQAECESLARQAAQTAKAFEVAP